MGTSRKGASYRRLRVPFGPQPDLRGLDAQAPGPQPVIRGLAFRPGRVSWLRTGVRSREVLIGSPSPSAPAAQGVDLLSRSGDAIAPDR